MNSINQAFNKVFSAHPMSGRYDNCHGDEDQSEVRAEKIESDARAHARMLIKEAPTELFEEIGEHKFFDAMIHAMFVDKDLLHAGSLLKRILEDRADFEGTKHVSSLKYIREQMA